MGGVIIGKTLLQNGAGRYLRSVEKGGYGIAGVAWPGRVKQIRFWAVSKTPSGPISDNAIHRC